MYSQRSDKASVDKLLDIAKNEAGQRVEEEGAIFWLSQSDDPARGGLSPVHHRANEEGVGYGLDIRAICILALAPIEPVVAQSLAQRVAAAPDGKVEFSFASRPGVCGDGKGVIGDGRHFMMMAWERLL